MEVERVSLGAWCVLTLDDLPAANVNRSILPAHCDRALLLPSASRCPLGNSSFAFKVGLRADDHFVEVEVRLLKDFAKSATLNWISIFVCKEPRQQAAVGKQTAFDKALGLTSSIGSCAMK